MHVAGVCMIKRRELISMIIFLFRCGIPVIIMGETGCGKTRLIRFMCELIAGPDRHKNLLLMKVSFSLNVYSSV